MGERFELTFFGTRGSRTVHGEQYLEYGGHTTCVGFKIGERQIIFDSGSGVVDLGQALIGEHFSSGRKGPVISYLFHTHCHYDHICGLPYYTPLYLANSTTYIYGPRSTQQSFEESIKQFIHPPLHPISLHEMAGEKVWNTVSEADTIYFIKGEEVPRVVRAQHAQYTGDIPDPAEVEVTIRCLFGYNHPKNGVMIYRIEAAGRAVVFATDVEGYVHGDQRLISFAKGADVLVHDAMYTEERYTQTPVPTQGWGHSTLEIATDAARQANVKRLYLIHHDPSHSDATLNEMEKVAQTRFPATISARCNTSVDLINEFSHS